MMMSQRIASKTSRTSLIDTGLQKNSASCSILQPYLTFSPPHISNFKLLTPPIQYFQKRKAKNLQKLGMPFQINLMHEIDIPAFAAVDAAAMAEWGVAKAMEKSHPSGDETRQQMIERWTRAGFRQDSELVWVKAVDLQSGEMAAAALWKFQFEDESSPLKDGDGGDDDDDDGKQPQEGGNNRVPTVMAALGAIWEEFKERNWGTRRHANLSILVSHPKYQRRGAGGMLVKWGCDRADERGLITVLQASSAGLNLYLKHGFEIVYEKELDLKPYGVDEVELRRGMVRQPRIPLSNTS